MAIIIIDSFGHHPLEDFGRRLLSLEENESERAGSGGGIGIRES